MSFHSPTFEIFSLSLSCPVGQCCASPLSPDELDSGLPCSLWVMCFKFSNEKWDVKVDQWEHSESLIELMTSLTDIDMPTTLYYKCLVPVLLFITVIQVFKELLESDSNCTNDQSDTAIDTKLCSALSLARQLMPDCGASYNRVVMRIQRDSLEQYVCLALTLTELTVSPLRTWR